MNPKQPTPHPHTLKRTEVLGSPRTVVEKIRISRGEAGIDSWQYRDSTVSSKRKWLGMRWPTKCAHPYPARRSIWQQINVLHVKMRRYFIRIGAANALPKPSRSTSRLMGSSRGLFISSLMFPRVVSVLWGGVGRFLFNSSVLVSVRRIDRARCPKGRRLARAPCSAIPKVPGHRMVPWRDPRPPRP